MKQVLSIIGVIGVLLTANMAMTIPVGTALVISCGLACLGINK